ncbi:winged helix-turn-helix domain-containing protein [Nocardiopsis alkaliphila]|uniref:winged helix-turn-helix domain-containing protein n=1 Tax=Nocardiopsis alkaliphila TaxID=225762 RepID=UPI000365D9E1|nr:winged helix-turn-helix domain-containing protein [Nocardiopsis alkaliphila]
MSDVPDFEPSPDAYVYAELADHIAARISVGDLPSGAKLPGERELAETYGVAVGTARRATKELRDRELVKTLPGKGTFVV